MACDATARLYDVDEDTVEFKKLDKTEKYDQGTVTFRAREGRLIDLDKLHESIWATRLSGGTRSGLVSLDVTAVGTTISTDQGTLLRVSGSDRQFVLTPHLDPQHADAFDRLQKKSAESSSEKQFRVTGRINDYRGRWPEVLRDVPANPRQIMVSTFEVVE